jgi:thymidylate synthase (FAD)
MDQQKNLSVENNSDVPRKIDPLEDGISSIELIRVSGSDVDIVNAARVSFGKFVKELRDQDKKLIKFLIEHHHTSPFEHNQLSFRIKCPLYVGKQWMRHRMNSYNEISYRYVKAPLEFYIPKHWRFQDTNNKQASFGAFNNEELLEQYKKSIEVATQAYNNLLESGVCREQARGLLPFCTYTEFIFTCNLHSFMNFLTLRLKNDAQYEIRVYAQGMLELAQPYFETSLGEWKKLNQK